MTPAPADTPRHGAAALALALAALALAAGPLSAAYTGRSAAPQQTHVVQGYRPHDGSNASTGADAYRQQLTAVDAGSIQTLAAITTGALTAVPVINCGGYSQLGIACTSNVATASFTFTPVYEAVDSSGNRQFHTGSDVTVTCDSEFTSQGAYTSGKAYVDTDGYPQMRLLLKSISSGDVDDPVTHTLTRLYVRVN